MDEVIKELQIALLEYLEKREYVLPLPTHFL